MPYKSKKKRREYIREYMREYRRKQKKAEDTLLKAFNDKRILQVIQRDFPDIFNLIEKRRRRKR